MTYPAGVPAPPRSPAASAASAAHRTAAPQPYLNRTGSNINNVAQYMYRENKKEFMKVLKDIQTKLPGIEKI